MHLIRTITEEDFERPVHPSTWSTFRHRVGARAILINKDNEIALMHVSNRNYYKLPGEGVEKDETLEQTLKRELHEEAGADDIEILAEIGEIDEIREGMQKKSIHYCYLVRLIGELKDTEQTEEELSQGYQIIWAKDIDQAIELVESSNPPEYGQDFECLRELTFLQHLKDSHLLDTL